MVKKGQTVMVGKKPMVAKYVVPEELILVPVEGETDGVKKGETIKVENQPWSAKYVGPREVILVPLAKAA